MMRSEAVVDYSYLEKLNIEFVSQPVFKHKNETYECISRIGSIYDLANFKYLYNISKESNGQYRIRGILK